MTGIHVLVLPAPGPQERGAPIVRAFEAALDRLGGAYDIVINVDADVSMEGSSFRRASPQHSSGILHWGLRAESRTSFRRHMGAKVRDRRYRLGRNTCVQASVPRRRSSLERRHGWDGIDQLRARSMGWTTRVLEDLPFRHHRREGERDGSRWAHWRVCGESSYYMGYRPWYLILRAAHQARREPASVAMLWGYASSVARRRPQWNDAAARLVLREDQRLRALLSRRREALGTRRNDAAVD